ncbi:MAG: FAD-binding oxidoreductase, partial [Chlorobi bacterium]|nr:FAD-binding oxidoreductase [Chlorobiota bacterium]
MAVETSHQRLAGAIGKDKVSTSWLDRIAYSCDASLYQLVPRVVVRADNISDVQEIFRWSRREHIPITFRAAGTSLSGQAVTEHALVLVRRFDKFTIADGGQYVTAGSSLRGGYINARLRPYHCRIGPDPASIDACTVGGIVANNASGMCCGIAQNAYHTLAAMTMVLPSGLVLSTCDCAEADRMLLEHEPALYEQLSKLRDHVRCDTDLVRTIRHRTRLKNTMGYSIAAFLDFERPADILQHLLVGSEGTLGFIADVTLRTVPEPPHATAALIGFDSITAACSAVSAFDGEGAVAVELMDRATLAAIATYAPASTEVRLPRDAALLIEFRYDDPDTSHHVRATIERISRLVCANQLTIASQEQQRKLLWTLRKGAMPSVGAARRTGTALINEDVAFPRERLADAVRDLQLLLAAHRFDDAVVFGHARDGNMHFAFSLDSDGSSIERYGQFMEQLAELVVERYDGSLKAEHSTGRNMAPFLEHQWGKRVVDLMRRVKQLLDPEGLLNPDVIFTQDRRIHLRNIKQLPPVSSHVDHCIECGFCERVCPSSELTLSPRQRIIVQREIVRHSRDCIARRLERDYVYAGTETCATDGLCMVTCPVGINSGDLTIAQRSQSKKVLERVYWQIAASRVRGWIRGIGIALSVARGASNVLGERLVHRTTERLARLFRIPSWLPAMGIPEHFSVTSLPEADVLYVPSCMACFAGRSPHG